MSEITDPYLLVLNVSIEMRDSLMRPREEIFQQSKLVDHIKRGRVNGVAAKIAQKVRVFFQHHHINARSGEQKAEHHSRRPSSGNAALSLNGLRIRHSSI